MAIENRWLEAIGGNSVRNSTDLFPTYMFFAGGDNTFDGTEINIENDYLHRAISWTKTGIDSKFTLSLRTTDCIGSNIQAYGFSPVEVGSDNPLVVEPSDIGLKVNSFSVEIEGEILFRRPLV